MNDAVIDAAPNDDGSAELLGFIERIESLEDEKQEAADAIREEYKFAKGRGFDVAILRKVIAARKQDPDALAEEMRVLATYMRAAGLDRTPLGEWARDNAGPIATKDAPKDAAE